MHWFVFTGTDGVLYVGRPQYNEPVRPRKPQFVDLVPPILPTGQQTVTVDDVTVTLDDTLVRKESIYLDTKEERLQRFVNKIILDPAIPLTSTTVVHIVDATDVPGDHPCKFRCLLKNAWEWDGTMVSVNMPKARILRDEEFKRIKVREILKAQALADDAEVARLKAITFDVSRFTNPGALEMAWPDGLPKS